VEWEADLPEVLVGLFAASEEPQDSDGRKGGTMNKPMANKIRKMAKPALWRVCDDCDHGWLGIHPICPKCGSRNTEIEERV
jgi:anaerobic ribonucleoside-triphosphate reductase